MRAGRAFASRGLQCFHGEFSDSLSVNSVVLAGRHGRVLLQRSSRGRGPVPQGGRIASGISALFAGIAAITFLVPVICSLFGAQLELLHGASKAPHSRSTARRRTVCTSTLFSSRRQSSISGALLQLSGASLGTLLEWNSPSKVGIRPGGLLSSSMEPSVHCSRGQRRRVTARAK